MALPPISPDDARRWAERLESARLTSSRWRQAAFSRNDELIYLVADGAYSTSVGEGLWVRKLADADAAVQLPGTFRAFSYASYGEHYLPNETAQSLDVLSARWGTYLEQLRPNQRLIPVCFSLGAAVTLLGLHRRLTSSSDAERIPAVILVAPAHAPAPELLDGYFDIAGELPPGGGIPTGVRQLCDPDNPVRDEVGAALQALPRFGVDLHIIFWPGDRLTPYVPIHSLDRGEREVLTSKTLTRVQDAAKEHINLRDDPEVTTAICAALAGYPTTEKPAE